MAEVLRWSVPRRRELHDPYFRKAKAEGYAARSAYKLLEINERRRLLRPGMTVLDLGCAPGSWMQVAAKEVGPQGRVIGIDLQAVAIELPAHARTIMGDVFDGKVLKHEAVESLVPFDLVLSDMAPNTTGGGSGDHFRSVALCRRVLEVLPRMLRHGGACVMKVFEGEEYPALLRETAAMFDSARGLKPKATREVSPEMFIIAEGYRSRRDAGAGADAKASAQPKGKPPAPRAGWGDQG